MTRNSKDLLELSKVLDGVSESIVKEVKSTIKSGAETMVEGVKKDSPVRQKGYSTSKKGKKLKRGTYQRGWKYKLKGETSNSVSYTVYNAGQQKSLTHLLEFGHSLPQGGTVKAIKHVLKNRDKAEEKIVQGLERIMDHVETK